MSFQGWKLRELRRRKALTLRDLAAEAGIGFDTVWAAENGANEPRPSTVRKLAAALGVEPETFFAEMAEGDETGKAAA